MADVDAGNVLPAVRRLAIGTGVFVAIYGLAMAVASPAGFPQVVNHGSFWPYLADAPLGEDAFYAFTVAWHFAGGQGIVYNHELPTTGIQPGVTFVYAVLAWFVRLAGGDKFLFSRSVLAFNLLAILLLAHHAGALGRRIADVAGLRLATAYWTTFAIVCSSCHVFNTFGYGLETGAYAVLVCWIARKSVEMLDADRDASLHRWIAFAIACGIAALVRVDFLLLLAGYLACSTLWRPRILWTNAIVGLVAILVVSPWLMYVGGVTGSPLQSSALAQWEPAPSWNMYLFRLYYLLQPIATTSVPLGGNVSHLFGTFSALVALGVAAALAVLYSISSDWRGTGRRFVHSRVTVALVCWASGVLALAAVYALFVEAIWFYGRYAFIAIPLTLPITGVVLASALTDGRTIVRTAAGAVLLISVASFPLGLWPRYHRGLAHYEQPILTGIVRNEHRGELVGAFQSGVMGFFHENVVNLDGKMNVDALGYIRSGTLGRYIDATGIRVILDWSIQFGAFMSSPEDSAYLTARFDCRELPPTTWVLSPTWTCRRK